MAIILVVNPGSSSKKYALFENGRPVLVCEYEKSNSEFQVNLRSNTLTPVVEPVTKAQYHDSFRQVTKEVQQYLEQNQRTLDAIGVRVVASGSDFQKHALVDDVYLSLLRAKEQTAPLHIPVVLREIQQCREYFPGVSIAAISDTAFFSSLPQMAREYSIRRQDASEFDIHRFGYHGLSVESVVNRFHSVTGKEPERLVVCHIGNGVSVTAVRNRAAVETSAGYGTLNSLLMGSRGGDIDAAALLELLRRNNWKPTEATTYLHTSTGLTGLAETDDLRSILDRKSQGDTAAAAALECFVYQLQKQIAALTVAAKGCDALVFTGTAAVRSPELRRLIIDGLQHMGLGIDEERNNIFLGREGIISIPRGLIKVVVMRTNEMDEIARSTEQIVSK